MTDLIADIITAARAAWDAIKQARAEREAARAQVQAQAQDDLTAVDKAPTP
jgi:hypothetical protein